MTERPVGTADIGPLTALHAATRAEHRVDGVYLTRAELAAGPDSVRSAPQVVDGELTADKPDGRLNWVTWLELQGSPTASVGGDRDVSWVQQAAPTVDEAGVTAYCRDNLDTYLAAQPDDHLLDAPAVVWTVPEHADLVGRCVRSRLGCTESFTTADGREAVALLRKVVAAGTRATATVPS